MHCKTIENSESNVSVEGKNRGKNARCGGGNVWNILIMERICVVWSDSDDRLSVTQVFHLIAVEATQTNRPPYRQQTIRFVIFHIASIREHNMWLSHNLIPNDTLVELLKYEPFSKCSYAIYEICGN